MDTTIRKKTMPLNPTMSNMSHLPQDSVQAGVPTMMAICEQAQQGTGIIHHNPLHTIVAGEATREPFKKQRRPGQGKKHRRSLAKHRKPSSSTPLEFESNEFFTFPCNHEELREGKDRFLVFIRIMFKYLEYRDRSACEEVKAAVRELANMSPTERQRKGEVALLMEIYTRVKRTVTPFQWSSSLMYYSMFLDKRRQARAAMMGAEIVPYEPEDIAA